MARRGSGRTPTGSARRRRSGGAGRNRMLGALAILGVFAAAWLAPAAQLPGPAELVSMLAPSSVERPAGSGFVAQAYGRHFPICGRQARIDCVVDGDTFYLAGERIRIADIDAPEVSSPGCASEAALGRRATERLQQLLNAGSFELHRGARDRDRYGRSLRTIHRDGRSLGDRLVAEGLARPWEGQRRSWCG